MDQTRVREFRLIGLTAETTADWCALQGVAPRSRGLAFAGPDEVLWMRPAPARPLRPDEVGPPRPGQPYADPPVVEQIFQRPSKITCGQLVVVVGVHASKRGLRRLPTNVAILSLEALEVR